MNPSQLESNNPSWNELYNQVQFIRVKSFYNEDFLLGMRQLLFTWINNNLPNVNCSQDNQKNFICGLWQQLTLIRQSSISPGKVINYWIESLDANQMMSSYSHYTQKIIVSFMGERSIYVNENPLSQQINSGIQYLRMLKMCNETSWQRFQFQLQSYRSINNSQFSANIIELNADIVASIQNIIQLSTNVLQKVIQYRNGVIKSGIDVIQCRNCAVPSRNDCSSPLWKEYSSKEYSSKEQSSKEKPLKEQSSKEKSSKSIKLPESCLSQLAEIQVWFDEIADIIWETRALIKKMQRCDAQLKQINQLFKNLIDSIMVLESQPSEIITILKNSPSTVRILLTLSKFIDVEKLNLVIFMFSKHTTDSDNEIRIGSSQFQVKENSITREFKHLKVLKVHRPRNCKKVAQKDENDNIIVAEKYILKFCLQFEIDGMQFNTNAVSWPFFVIVNQIQEHLAKAARSWDKHFPNVDRAKSSASVPWVCMETLLEEHFNVETGCNLNKMHLDALYEKAYNEKIIIKGAFVWSKSCQNMRRWGFSFWFWFDNAMKLTRECLSEPWKEGLIDGFVSEMLINQKLLNQPAGTFLLRFSDSEVGAITPVYIEYDENNVADIKKYVPYSIKEFVIPHRSPQDKHYFGIGNLISKDNVEKCTHMNGVSKSVLFKKHCVKLSEKSKEGYVTRLFPESLSASVSSSSLSPSPYQTESTVFDDDSRSFISFNSSTPNLVPNQISPVPNLRKLTQDEIASELNTPLPRPTERDFSFKQNDLGNTNIHFGSVTSNMTTFNHSDDVNTSFNYSYDNLSSFNLSQYLDGFANNDENHTMCNLNE